MALRVNSLGTVVVPCPVWRSLCGVNGYADGVLTGWSCVNGYAGVLRSYLRSLVCPRTTLMVRPGGVRRKWLRMGVVLADGTLGRAHDVNGYAGCGGVVLLILVYLGWPWRKWLCW
jgi:hypothetical protein